MTKLTNIFLMGLISLVGSMQAMRGPKGNAQRGQSDLARARQDQRNNAAPNSTNDLQRALALSKEEYDREQEFEMARLQSIKGLNDELFSAIENGATQEKVNLLLDQGAEITAIGDEGGTPLHQAVLYEHPTLTSLLMGRGAVVACVDNYGNTPLHLLHDIETGVILLDQGADLMARAKDGGTPLHTCCVSDASFDVCKFLVDKGADVQAIDNRGETPFIWALETDCDENFDKEEQCKLLAPGGAPINVHDDCECTAFCLACNTGSIDMCQLTFANAYLGCPKKEIVTQARARLRTALLSLKRTVKLKVPRELRYMILCSISAVEEDLLLVLYYDLCNGNALCQYEINILINRLPGYTLKVFMELLKHTIEGENPLMVSVLDPDTLQTNFGKVIADNVRKRVALLQQKALEGALTKGSE